MAGSTGAAGSNIDGGADGGTCPAGATRHDGGACICSASAPKVCGNNCVDPMTDPDNCGTCGMKCAATATCNKGTCGATPTTLVPAAAGCTAIHLALSGTTLYWTDSGHGTVKSIGTAAGATATTIAMNQMKPTLLSLGGPVLFWLDSGSKTIMKYPVAGPAATVYTSATDDIHGFATSTDQNTVYFSSGMNVSKVPAAGGTATVIDTQADGIPMSLALGGTTIVFGSDNAQDVDAIFLADGTVSMCGMKDAGGNGFCTNGLRLGRSQGSILFDSIFLLGGKVYWAANNDIRVDATMLAADGAAPQFGRITSTAMFTPPTAFTIQGTSVYLAEDGFIESSPLIAESDATILARGQMTPGSIAADANNIYWSTGDCAINTMPVPK